MSKECKCNDWVSVKTKLPELNKEVLCYTVVENHPCAGTTSMISSYRYKMSNCDNEHFNCENSYKKVTHWMKIDPPKGIK